MTERDYEMNKDYREGIRKLVEIVI